MTTRAVLRYHGGKHNLAQWIISHFPAHRCYVEPFSGAASVLMQKPKAKTEVYNDLDQDVFNLFRVLRDDGPELKRRVELTPFSKDEHDLAYEMTDDPIEKARRMLVRAAFGRASASASSPWKASFRSYTGAGRTTTAAQDWANYPLFMDEIVKRLQGVVIENMDATDVIKAHDSAGTLFYVDPPYVSSSRDLAQDYKHEMTDKDHEALAATLKAVSGMVVISGYRTDLYDALYSDWQRFESKAHADGASKRIEALWLSPNTPSTTLF